MITICELFPQYLTAYKWLIILKRSKLDGFLDEYVNQDKEFVRLENEYLMCRTSQNIFGNYSNTFIHPLNYKENINLHSVYLGGFQSIGPIGPDSIFSQKFTYIDYFIMIGKNELRHNVHLPNISPVYCYNDFETCQYWYKYGRLHRKDNPAIIIIYKEKIYRQEYYSNGKKFIVINKELCDLLGVNVVISINKYT